MKSILHYTKILVAAVLLVSCGEDAPVNNVTPSDPATLDINDNLVQVSAKGGEYEFTYTLTNPNDKDQLEPSCADSWVHDFDLSIDGTVLFTVDPNTTTESRITNVYLKYGSVSDKVVISQTGVGMGDIEYQFDIEYDIDGPYVTMTVTPEPEETRYYAWYYSKKGMETALEQSPGVDIVMYLNRLVEVEMSNAIYYGAYAGFTAEEAVDQLTLVGKASQNFELNGETSFYGFVCAVSKMGDRLSDVVYTEFTTGTVAPSDNQLSVTINDINTDRIDFSIATTNDDQYAAMVLPATDVEDMTDKDIVAMFNSIDNYLIYLHRGNYADTAIVANDDTDYCVLVFGFEYGMATTEIHREMVHTLKSNPDAIPEFNITVDKVTHYRVKATVEGTPKTCLYYADLCYADEKPEDLIATVREAAQWYVDNGYYPHIIDCLRIVSTKGKQPFEFTGLEAETEYRVYAIGIDETTGEFNTEVYFSDVITTPAPKVSESYIEIPVGKYYDGYDLKDAYPEEFSDADGWAVIPLEVTTHGDVVSYFYDVYLGDVTDTTYPTDDEIILDLQMYGISNNPLSMSYCYFNEPLTLIYFSKDSEDNNSSVTRVLFTMTPGDCASIDEFEADYGAKLQSVVYKQSREL